MPASAKPRKKYRARLPAGQMRVPITLRHAQKSETMLALIPHAQLQAFADGEGQEGFWHTLASRINWGWQMVLDWGDIIYSSDIDLLAILTDAQNALRSVQTRHEQTGKWGMAGAELSTLRVALTICDELTAVTTRRQHLQSLRRMLAKNEQAQSSAEGAQA